MAIAVGQHTAKGVAAGTITTDAIASSASGSIFVIGIVTDGAMATPTDSKSNTYTEAAAEFDTGGVATAVYYVENGTGGSGHTFSVTCAGASLITMVVVEITGGLTASALDQANRAQDVSSPFDSPGVTTMQADEILIGIIFETGPSGDYTHTMGNSFTKVDEITDGSSFLPGASSYRVVAATGTYNTSVTFPSVTPDDTADWIVTFKAAAGGSQTLSWLPGQTLVQSQPKAVLIPSGMIPPNKTD